MNDFDTDNVDVGKAKTSFFIEGVRVAPECSLHFTIDKKSAAQKIVLWSCARSPDHSSAIILCYFILVNVKCTQSNAF